MTKSDYIKELISLFTYQAEKRNINLCFDYEQEELPAWIDPNNFDKVLVNLLSNAFKYTPDGKYRSLCYGWKSVPASQE